MKRLPLAPADSVLLYGAGPIGLLLLQALRHRGAGQIVVVDKQANRLALAAQLGATATFAPSADLDGQLRALAPIRRCGWLRFRAATTSN